MLTLFVSLFGTEANRFRGIPAVAASSPRFKEQLFRAFAKPDETKGAPFRFLSILISVFHTFNFSYFTTDWIFEKPKGPPSTIFGSVRFFVMIIFCLEIVFPQWHAISEFLFLLRVGFFLYAFLIICCYRNPASRFLLETKHLRELLGVFGTIRLTEDVP